MTILIVPFWLVLILLIVGNAIAIIKENGPSTSLFFFWNALIVTCLAFLWGGH